MRPPGSAGDERAEDGVGNLVASPCCTPRLGLPECLDLYAGLGFRKFEAFTSWARSALDWRADPAAYRADAARRGLLFTSMHLPPVTGERFDASLADAVAAARFAADLGAGVVLFKADALATYGRAAGPFLDATEDLAVVPVLQNHFGTPIASLEDYRQVRTAIGDARMRSLLEVGHFHAAGVRWEAGMELLGETIALVHVKDMVGARSVPFGTGEIDLPALFRRLSDAGYGGDFVVEMEVEDADNTVAYLGDALSVLEREGVGRP